MEEAIYFSHQGVSVSHSRFIINGKTFSIHHVNTVERRVLHPQLGFARLSMLAAIALLFGSGSLSLIGVFSLIYGGVLWFSAAPQYSVVIHTSSGEFLAFSSDNSSDAENVLTAFNVAIALKGDARRECAHKALVHSKN